MSKIKLGSCFSGIGGFELGLHWAIPNLETLWQIEQNKYCQKVLQRHWPKAQIHDDITKIDTTTLDDIDILCAGFPCQDISIANHQGMGLDGKKSGLFWDLRRIISDFREHNRTIPLLLLENVPAITFRGLGTVLGSLSQIGYDAEWFDLRASDYGHCHKRERWFCVCYASNSNSLRSVQTSNRGIVQKDDIWKQVQQRRQKESPNSNSTLEQRDRMQIRIQTKQSSSFDNVSTLPNKPKTKKAPKPTICRMDDGFSPGVHNNRLRALGNSIVPQCSEWIGQRLLTSGLIEDILGAEYVH